MTTPAADEVDDDLLLEDDSGDETAAQSLPANKRNWKVLIVDDEVEVHNITRLALQDFSFQGYGLNFLYAYSGEEGRRIIAENPDTAVILLDVVMESDDAGLLLIRHIREELRNHMVRIILRTGQPGQAPEQKIIVNYDINDYKTKTELTAEKLFTTIVASLRSYRDLETINNNKKGLEKIIESSASIFELQSFEKFISGVLQQITALLHLDENSMYCNTSTFLTTSRKDGELVIVAGTGAFADFRDRPATDVLPGDIMGHVKAACLSRKSVFSEHFSVIYVRGKSGGDNVIYLEKEVGLSPLDVDLLQVFCSNLSSAFENMRLNHEIDRTQREIVFTIGAIAETRSKETGYHVKRVAEYSKLFALLYGMGEAEAELLKQASPLHDIGKVGIPDAILNKPGKHTAEEWSIMRTHAELGFEMLKHSETAVLKAGALIAYHHHEKWNGSGYPRGLSGDDIHIYGRITAIADVFDALGSDRCYKKAWPMESILDFMKQERGQHFDPGLVDLLFKHLDQFLSIRERYADSRLSEQGLLDTARTSHYLNAH